MRKYAAAEHTLQPLPGTDHVSLEGAQPHTANEPAAGSPPGRRRAPAEAPASTGSWLDRYRRRVLILDGVAVVVSLALVSLVRPGPDVSDWGIPLGLVLSLAWFPAVALCHGYVPKYLGAGPEEYRALLHASLLVFGIVSAVCLLGQRAMPRDVVILVLPTTLLVSLLLRHQLRRWLARQRRQGRCQQRAVAVGREDSVAGLISEIRRAPAHSIDVVAVCTTAAGGAAQGTGATGATAAAPSEPAQPLLVEEVPVHGTPVDVLAAVDYFDADVVAVAAHPDLSGDALRELAWQLEERQVDLIVSPGILEVAGPRLSIRAEAGLALLHVERPVTSGAPMLLKKVMDASLALLLTMMVAPLMLVVALSVRLSSPGPVFYRQQRVGARGQTFDMLKFRSMRIGSDAPIAVASGADPRGVKAGKGEGDPRVTRVGRVLRRLSLDELPQLVNVLRGEMSLVGPRPPLPSEVAQYESVAMRRLRVQPGMTGLWQVSGRSDLDWEQSLRLDLWYVDNWSPMTDLQILVRTARAVARGTGAY